MKNHSHQNVYQKIMLLSVLFFMLLPSLLWAEKSIIIGGKNFTEQFLLVEMAKQVLEAQGFTTEVKAGVGSAIARQGLEAGQIDMYYEYTGTAYTVYYKQKDLSVMTNPDKLYAWLQEKEAEKGLVWLDRVAFNNTYALMMQKAQADKLGVKTLEDLGKHVSKHKTDLIFSVDVEFYGRPDGFPSLAKTYRFRPPTSHVKKMDLGLIYSALKNGDIHVGMGFATDGRISAFNFLVLEDNLNFFPVYNPAPVIRKEKLDQYPEIADALLKISSKLDTLTMQNLNAAVDVDKKAIPSVAKDWLTSNGIL